MKTRAKKAIYIALALVVFLVIGSAIFAATFDINRYRPEIESVLREKLQRDVNFRDKMEFQVFPNPTIKLLDVTIGNPGWAKTPYLAHVKEFSLKVAFTPLLSRQIVIDGVTIEGADVNLETQGDKKNWEFSSNVNPAQIENAPRTTDPKKVFVPLGVSNATVKNSVIHVAQDSKLSEYTIENLGFDWPPAGDAKIDFSLLVGQEKLAGTIKGGSLAAWQSNKDFPIDLDASFGKFKANGQLALKGRTKIEQIKGAFTASSTDGLSAKGDTAFNFNEDKSVKIALHLKELFIGNGETGVKAASGDMDSPAATAIAGQRIIPDIIFPRNFLSSLRANADIKIDAFKKGSIDFGSLSSHLVAAGGIISSDNTKINMPNSPLQLRFTYNSVSSLPQLSLNASSPNLNYGALLKTFDISHRFTGTGDFDLSLSGSGLNLREWMATSNGSFNLNAGTGTFDQKYMRTVGADILKIFSVGGGKSDVTSINCAIIRSKGQNGIYNVAPIAINSDVVALIGKGTVDFKSETMNILLSPQNNDRLKISEYLPSARITGSLAEPKALTDQQSVVSRITKFTDKNKSLKGLGKILSRFTGTKDSGPDASLNNSCVSIAPVVVMPEKPDVAAEEQPATIVASPDAKAPEAGAVTVKEDKKTKTLNLLNSLSQQLQNR